MWSKEREIAATIGVPVARRHIFLCAEQTTPKCCDKAAGIAAWDLPEEAAEGARAFGPGRHPADEGELPAHLRRRADRRRLPGGRVVRALRSAGARAHHPGAPDRRTPGRRASHHRPPAPAAVRAIQSHHRALNLLVQRRLPGGGIAAAQLERVIAAGYLVQRRRRVRSGRESARARAGVPNVSRVPWTKSIGRATCGRWASRRRSGWPGGCSG